MQNLCRDGACPVSTVLNNYLSKIVFAENLYICNIVTWVTVMWVTIISAEIKISYFCRELVIKNLDK